MLKLLFKPLRNHTGTELQIKQLFEPPGAMNINDSFYDVFTQNQ